jgi:phenylalanyl-tRNA synthetase alpha chain
MNSFEMDKLQKIKLNFEEKIKKVLNGQQLKDLRNEFISKNGSITVLMQNIRDLPLEEKKTYGAEVNKLKMFAEEEIFILEKEFENQKIREDLKNDNLDITIPPRKIEEGLVHPMTKVQRELQEIFQSMGFAISDGPEIEDDWHCFEALNMPPSHPARQMQDTFYMPNSDDGKEIVLRTQTTSIEIRDMLKGRPPFKTITMGKVYRRDFDATHVPMFHQIEAFYVDIGITMANLKYLIAEFCRKFFEVENINLRFRPSYFPYTAPSMEVDMRCTKDGGKIIKFGEGNDWVELGGSGMLHPVVLKNVNLNPDEYQGFAFGFGIERLAMLKYGISDMRHLYEGDLRFLKHYGFKFFEI